MLERLNEEIRRCTYVVRTFPNSESFLRWVRALTVEPDEVWLAQSGCVKEHKKEALLWWPDDAQALQGGMHARFSAAVAPALHFGQGSDGGSEGRASARAHDQLC